LSKSLKAKPIFYAVAYEALKNIAREFGYNLLIDGSLNRDLDLVLIPWHDKHHEVMEVLEAFKSYLGGSFLKQGSKKEIVSKMIGGAGRKKAVIDLNRSTRFSVYGDEEWYLDITII
jgi:hypothetical protein